jgi:hypothetical protein
MLVIWEEIDEIPRGFFFYFTDNIGNSALLLNSVLHYASQRCRFLIVDYSKVLTAE